MVGVWNVIISCAPTDVLSVQKLLREHEHQIHYATSSTGRAGP